MKVFSVAGYHHTGKTTTTVAIIKELKKRGYVVQSIKDIHAENYQIDKEGSNSWQHWEASNERVIARSFNGTNLIWHERLSLNQMLDHLQADYVVVEGMKTAFLPRIICAESEDQLEELVDGKVFAISGKWANKHSKYKNLPVLKSIEDVEKIVDLIEEKVFEVLPMSKPECCSACGLTCETMVSAILAGKRKRSDCLTDRTNKIEITVGNRNIKIVPYMQNMITDTINALLDGVSGCEKGTIKIKIRR